MKDTDQLPREPESERYVLGCMIAFPECGDEATKLLKATDFVDPLHAAIYDTFSQQRANGGIDIALAAREVKHFPDFGPKDSALGYLIALEQKVATSAHVAHEAGKIVGARLKRQRIEFSETLSTYAQDGYTHDQWVNVAWAGLEDMRRVAASTVKPRFAGITATEFATTKYEQRYIVDRILVDRQPCVIGGPKKSLKTSLAVDLAISFATGRSLLGKFPVLEQRRVLVCSAESGPATLQDTSIRVCRDVGCELGDIEGLTFSEALPRMLDAIDLGEFARFLDDVGPEVVILDPLYRMHSGEGAESVFKMGNPLAELGELCLSHGATPIICHHLKTSRLNQYAPAELDDLAYAGCAEYFRQWLLLSRRRAYEPGSGQHALWLTVGGSAGHNSLWALDIDEGTIDDPGGRRWDVTVSKADEARQNEQQRKDDTKAADRQQQLDDDRAAVCRLLAKYPAGASKTFLRDHSGISGRRWPGVFAAMFQAGDLVECEITVGNKKTPMTGYRLNTSEGA